MIPSEILFDLVPNSDPEDDFPRDPMLLDFDPKSPGRRVGIWAAYLRHRVYREMMEDRFLSDLIETSGFLGTGVFRVPNIRDADDYPGFPILSGYQFGAVLLRGSRAAKAEITYIRGISLEFGRYKAPVIQTIASFNPHGPVSQDGYVAAVFEEGDGEECGITAAHVVSGFRRGQRVPVLCSDCGDAARLRKKAPGLIDAATVEFPCGGPRYANSNHVSVVRTAIEGETVEAHFGDTGKKLCTVMMSLSSPSQIKCAAAPQHFLTDVHGHPGDSGSLISGTSRGLGEPDLIGMYLGDADCEDQNRGYVTYGYGLDLKQAAELLGAGHLTGEFHV